MNHFHRKPVCAVAAVMGLLCLISPAHSLRAMEFGAYAGTLNETGTTLIGLTLDSGFLVPIVKVETEAYMFVGKERSGKVITLALKIRPNLGRVAPYAVAGVGTELERLDFSQAKDRYFTFIGGGVVVGLAAIFSVRLDIRFQQHGESSVTIGENDKINYASFTAGIVVRI